MNKSALMEIILLIEEMAELQQALSKYVRDDMKDEKLNKSYHEIRENIIEEIADVEYCLTRIKQSLHVHNSDILKKLMEKSLLPQ